MSSIGILMSMVGFVAGCGVMGLIWVIVSTGSRKRRTAAEMTRAEVMGRLGNILAEAENAQSACALGTMPWENMKTTVSQQMSELRTGLKQNMHILDSFQIRYLEKSIEDALEKLAGSSASDTEAAAPSAAPVSQPFATTQAPADSHVASEVQTPAFGDRLSTPAEPVSEPAAAPPVFEGPSEEQAPGFADQPPSEETPAEKPESVAPAAEVASEEQGPGFADQLTTPKEPAPEPAAAPPAFEDSPEQQAPSSVNDQPSEETPVAEPKETSASPEATPDEQTPAFLGEPAPSEEADKSAAAPVFEAPAEEQAPSFMDQQPSAEEPVADPAAVSPDSEAQPAEQPPSFMEQKPEDTGSGIDVSHPEKSATPPGLEPAPEQGTDPVFDEVPSFVVEDSEAGIDLTSDRGESESEEQPLAGEMPNMQDEIPFEPLAEPDQEKGDGFPSNFGMPQSDEEPSFSFPSEPSVEETGAAGEESENRKDSEQEQPNQDGLGIEGETMVLDPSSVMDDGDSSSDDFSGIKIKSGEESEGEFAAGATQMFSRENLREAADMPAAELRAQENAPAPERDNAQSKSKSDDDLITGDDVMKQMDNFFGFE
jgi:hypothetical protein